MPGDCDHTNSLTNVIACNPICGFWGYSQCPQISKENIHHSKLGSPPKYTNVGVCRTCEHKNIPNMIFFLFSKKVIQCPVFLGGSWDGRKTAVPWIYMGMKNYMMTMHTCKITKTLQLSIFTKTKLRENIT